MRAIPGMKVFQPCDAAETKAIIKGIAEIDGPCYVRLGRGGVEDVFDENYKFEMGKGVVLKKGSKVALIATGMMVQEALKASEELIVELAKSHDVLITCEEHNVVGGLGSAVAEVAVKRAPVKMAMVGVQDTFGESGTPKALCEKYGLDAAAIVKKVKEVL